MSVLICGSLAFDSIMVFPDHFSRHILPEKIHMLNVSFLVPEMRREFGGCAGNIAWNVQLLGDTPVIMAACGDDFTPYASHLDQHGISRQHIRQVPGTFTGQAFITTDLADNQITAFHPGAMAHSHLNRADSATGIRLGIVAPDGRDGMLQHATQLSDAHIPFIFDPGQGMPMFSGEELLNFVHQASYVTVNDYEAELLQEKTGQSLAMLARQVRALIITRGEAGSLIMADEREYVIPPVPADAVVDPTGCGDAYRAGLIHGILHQMDWERTGRLASLMGSIKIAHRGGQNHAPDQADIRRRYRDAFGHDLS